MRYLVPLVIALLFGTAVFYDAFIFQVSPPATTSIEAVTPPRLTTAPTQPILESSELNRQLDDIQRRIDTLSAQLAQSNKQPQSSSSSSSASPPTPETDHPTAEPQAAFAIAPAPTAIPTPSNKLYTWHGLYWEKAPHVGKLK